jgi:hypothetical protein
MAKPINIVQVQKDITGVLASADSLLTVNVKEFREMQLQSEVDVTKIYTTVRNGRTGCGVLVEMPVAICDRPAVNGPVLDWIFPVTVVENPTVNMNKRIGTLLSAEEVCQLVLDVLHLYADDGLGTLQADKNVITKNTEYAGCIAYRLNFKLIGKTQQTERVKNLSYSLAGGFLTIASPTADTEIRFTLDKSFPTKIGNAASLVYTGPLPVASGDLVRAVAYKPLLLNSSAIQVAVP